MPSCARKQLLSRRTYQLPAQKSDNVKRAENRDGRSRRKLPPSCAIWPLYRGFPRRKRRQRRFPPTQAGTEEKKEGVSNGSKVTQNTVIWRLAPAALAAFIFQFFWTRRVGAIHSNNGPSHRKGTESNKKREIAQRNERRQAAAPNLRSKESGRAGGLLYLPWGPTDLAATRPAPAFLARRPCRLARGQRGAPIR